MGKGIGCGEVWRDGLIMVRIEIWKCGVMGGWIGGKGQEMSMY